MIGKYLITVGLLSCLVLPSFARGCGPPDDPAPTSQPPSASEQAYAQIAALQEAPSGGGSPVEQARLRRANRLRLVEKADIFVQRFPHSPLCDAVLVAKLEALAALAFMDGDRSGLLSASREVLALDRGRKSGALAAHYLLQAELQRAASQGASASELEELFVARALEYLAKYPDGASSAGWWGQLIDHARAQNDPAGARAYFDQLARYFPEHQVTRRYAPLFKRGPEVGRPFAMRFTALTGEVIDLSNLRGKVVLVDFWATWCAPCVQAMPELKALYEKHGAGRLEIIGVNLDTDKAKVIRFIKDYGITWPQYFDGKMWDNALAEANAVNALPVTFLIDRNGILRMTRVPGPLEDALSPFLQSSPD